LEENEQLHGSMAYLATVSCGTRGDMKVQLCSLPVLSSEGGATVWEIQHSNKAGPKCKDNGADKNVAALFHVIMKVLSEKE